MSEQHSVSYIFYTSGTGSDFSRNANWKKDQLEEYGENVVMHEVNSSEEFESAWNGMGVVDGENVNIKSVYIYSHGPDRALIFENGSSTNAMSIDGKNKSGGEVDGNINDLEKKEIQNLYLYSCNGGHIISYLVNRENLASVLSKKVTSGVVYAYDGNTSFGYGLIPDKYRQSFETRLSNKQDSFYSIAEQVRGYPADRGWLKPEGQVAYSNGFKGMPQYISAK